MEPTSLTFDALRLASGQTMELIIQVEQKNSVFPCVFAGCLPEESMIIVPPTDTGALPGLSPGQVVAIRVKLPNGIAVFSVPVLFVSEIPTIMVYLDLPQHIKFKPIRHEVRVVVRQPVLGYNKTRPEKSAVVGSMIDVSAAGACLAMDDDFGQCGDKVSFKGSYNIANLQKTIAIEAVIKRVNKIAQRYHYGLCFEDIPDEQRIFLFGFIYQAMIGGELRPLY